MNNNNGFNGLNGFTTMAKKFKIVTRELPDGDDFEYKDFENYDEAFQYCFKKVRKEQCSKVELYERTDDSTRSARLCPIAKFYHW